jgi:LuxR family transcriptional regulator, quorum-sensing system regulator SolR
MHACAPSSSRAGQIRNTLRVPWSEVFASEVRDDHMPQDSPPHDDSWWLEVHSNIASARSAEEIFEHIKRAVLELGFSYCSFGVRVAAAVSQPSTIVMANYPAGWMERYNERNYVATDPTVNADATKTKLMVWSDALFERAPTLWAEAREHGLRVGAAQGSWGRTGASALLSVARESETLCEPEVRRLEPRLRWLCDSGRNHMQAIMPGPEASIECLTYRERQVIGWTAEGKTSWEIATILAISENTVNFHMKNILSKLKVKNKIQAAVKAFALGLSSETMSANSTEAAVPPKRK